MNQLVRLPKTCLSNDVKIENKTIVTTDDIDAILQWEWTIKIDDFFVEKFQQLYKVSFQTPREYAKK